MKRNRVVLVLLVATLATPSKTMASPWVLVNGDFVNTCSQAGVSTNVTGFDFNISSFQQVSRVDNVNSAVCPSIGSCRPFSSWSNLDASGAVMPTPTPWQASKGGSVHFYSSTTTVNAWAPFHFGYDVSSSTHPTEHTLASATWKASTDCAAFNGPLTWIESITKFPTPTPTPTPTATPMQPLGPILNLVPGIRLTTASQSKRIAAATRARTIAHTESWPDRLAETSAAIPFACIQDQNQDMTSFPSGSLRDMPVSTDQQSDFQTRITIGTTISVTSATPCLFAVYLTYGEIDLNRLLDPERNATSVLARVTPTHTESACSADPVVIPWGPTPAAADTPWPKEPTWVVIETKHLVDNNEVQQPSPSRWSSHLYHASRVAHRIYIPWVIK